MKVKVVEAMMYGVPVVATGHAIDGLPPGIAEECMKWGDESIRRRDPRENTAVLEELQHFTSVSFQTKFSARWNERVALNGVTRQSGLNVHRLVHR